MAKKKRNDTVGARVTALRNKWRITQAELAARAGLPASTVCAIERGRNLATSGDTQASLANGFGLTTDELRGYLRGDTSTEGAFAKGIIWDKP